MESDPDDDARQRRDARFVERLPQMVEAGRVTEEEAAEVRSAAESGVPDGVAQVMRLKHGRQRIEEALRDGVVNQEEADALLQRLESGESPQFSSRSSAWRRPSATRIAWPFRGSSYSLTGAGRRSSLRRSWALRATTMVEALIRMAPTAGDRVIPAKVSTPAARGMANRL